MNHQPIILRESSSDPPQDNNDAFADFAPTDSEHLYIAGEIPASDGLVFAALQALRSRTALLRKRLAPLHPYATLPVELHSSFDDETQMADCLKLSSMGLEVPQHTDADLMSLSEIRRAAHQALQEECGVASTDIRSRDSCIVRAKDSPSFSASPYPRAFWRPNRPNGLSRNSTLLRFLPVTMESPFIPLRPENLEEELNLQAQLDRSTKGVHELQTQLAEIREAARKIGEAVHPGGDLGELLGEPAGVLRCCKPLSDIRATQSAPVPTSAPYVLPQLLQDLPSPHALRLLQQVVERSLPHLVGAVLTCSLWPHYKEAGIELTRDMPEQCQAARTLPFQDQQLMCLFWSLLFSRVPGILRLLTRLHASVLFEARINLDAHVDDFPFAMKVRRIAPFAEALAHNLRCLRILLPFIAEVKGTDLESLAQKFFWSPLSVELLRLLGDEQLSDPALSVMREHLRLCSALLEAIPSNQSLDLFLNDFPPDLLGTDDPSAPRNAFGLLARGIRGDAQPYVLPILSKCVAVSVRARRPLEREDVEILVKDVKAAELRARQPGSLPRPHVIVSQALRLSELRVCLAAILSGTPVKKKQLQALEAEDGVEKLDGLHYQPLRQQKNVYYLEQFDSLALTDEGRFERHERDLKKIVRQGAMPTAFALTEAGLLRPLRPQPQWDGPPQAGEDHHYKDLRNDDIGLARLAGLPTLRPTASERGLNTYCTATPEGYLVPCWREGCPSLEKVRSTKSPQKSLTCPQCRVASYCSAKCAESHWKRRHAIDCATFMRPPSLLRFAPLDSGTLKYLAKKNLLLPRVFELYACPLGIACPPENACPSD